jgi:hypothetical protein
VHEAVSEMKTMDMSVEGVFRKNGNIKRLNDAKEEIDAKGAVEMDLTKENPVQVAALLKKFLRELPDPLLTHKLNKLWITSQRIEDSERRRRVMHLTCCLLPKPHRDTMEVLFTFLNWVSSFSHVDEESGSKMDIHNLATVITPNVIHRGKENVPVDDSFLAIEAVHSLIEMNEGMCEVSSSLLSFLFSRISSLARCMLMEDNQTGPRRSRPHPQRLLPLLQLRRHHDEGNPQTLRRPRQSSRHHGSAFEFQCIIRRCFESCSAVFFITLRRPCGATRRSRSEYGICMAKRIQCQTCGERFCNSSIALCELGTEFK